MKRALLLALPLVMYGDSLKSLLDYTTSHNELVVSKKISKKAKEMDVTSTKHGYYPTLDVGAFYQRSDDASPFNPGTTYSALAKVSYDIYSGGKKSNEIAQKKDALSATTHEYASTKNSMTLAVVQTFYNLKSLEATLKAQEESANAVHAQLERMQKFVAAKLATNDDVDRLQSAYDKNIYAIESIKFQIFSLKQALELKVGKKIGSLDDSTFKKVEIATDEELDAIKALRATKNSLLKSANMIDSYYYPQIKVEDTYSLFGYMDKPTLPTGVDLLDNQNKLLLTLTMRAYDFGALKSAKESVKLNATAMQRQIEYKSKEQKMNQELALKRIETAKLNIKSSASALKAASSALETITQKYNTGIVDNVVYLDALSSQTEAKAMFESSQNSLEVAYALYYYYNAKNLEEFLSE